MINTNLPEFIEVANTFNHWFPYIVNSFNKDEYGKRMSNGKIEGSNNKIKVIKRVSYGYSDFYHLRNRIMYIFNDDEKPSSFSLKLNKIKDTKKLFYKPRKSMKKGQTHKSPTLYNPNKFLMVLFWASQQILDGHPNQIPTFNLLNPLIYSLLIFKISNLHK